MENKQRLQPRESLSVADYRKILLDPTTIPQAREVVRKKIFELLDKKE